MALFKINKGLNANLPVPRHDGYAYFTTDDGKFWIDFEDNTDGVLQDDGTKVSRRALNAERADYVGYALTLQFDGDNQPTYNGLVARTYNISPENIHALSTVNGGTVAGETIFNNVVYLNDETYADSLTAENEIVTGTLRVVGDLNGSIINATTFNGTLNGNATSADKVNHWLKIQLNGTDAAQYDGSGSNKTVNITPAAIGALDTSVLYALGDAVGGNAVAANKLTVNAGASNTPVYFSNGVPTAVTGTQNINVASADKVNHWLKIQLNGTDAAQYDGSSSNKTVNVTAASIGALDSGTLYAGSATQGGSASSAVKLDNDKDAGSNILPVYFSSGVPVAVSTSDEINILARQANKTTYWLKLQADGTDQVTFDGSTQNKTLNITPELINAVRRNGDTIPGPLTINGVFTVNNDVYMDSATVGDLLVNGGTRFVGDVNAGKITASQFIGPLQGNATSADKVNNWLKIQVNGTDKVQYDGSGGNKTINLTAEMLGLLGNTTLYALGDAVGGNAVKANALNVSAAIGSTTRPVYIQASGVPAAISNTDEIDLVAKSANAVKENFIFQIKGTEQWRYNGSTARTMNLSPALIDAFDIVEGSTVSGEAIFNNVVYLNDETYVDSLTAENEIVTGTLRVVGDLNGSVINATTFNGALNGNATSADKVNHWLKIQCNGTDQATYDGSSSNKTVNITAANIGALGSGTLYAGSATQGGSASSAEKLDNDKDAGSSILPIYFSSGVPIAVSTSDEINILAKQANKTTHWLKIQFNSTDQVTFDGSSSNKTLNITPSAIGALSTSTNYAGSTSVGGAANSANKLNTDAGDATHPVYFANGVPVQVSGTQNINVDSADKVNHWLKIQTDSTDAVTYDGSSSNKTVNITPEIINAVRRNGDTIPGPLTINGIFTVNNDAYIDSATVGDLLVNGGTRFVGDVNAGKITSSQFVGPLQGNATSADKVNYWLKIQVNGTDKVQYDGSGQNKTLNLTPELLGVLGGTTKYALGDAVGGNAVAANKLNTNAGSTTRPVYFDAGIPKVISNTDEVDLVAKKANSLKENFIYQLRGTEQWRFNGSTARTLNIVPNDMGIFDTIEGSTVSGEAVFNNVVYLNDETYADSLTTENEIVTGTLRVVGDLNGSVINATTFNGNATSADKVNHWLKIQFNGTDQAQFDGSASNKTVNITPSAIGALSTSTNYAGSSSIGGAATSANKLNTNAGSSTLPVYFTGGVPSAVSTTDEINIVAKQANKTTYWLKIQADSTDQVTFDGSTQNKTLNITPELINAVRRNGDTIPGPLTINGVFTVNNDAYIDSATIGDLLVNGGTRFVGDVNAGKITASSFVGPLTGNATSADKVNHWLKIQVNGTDKVTYDGSTSNKTLNLTPSMLGLLGNDTMYALGDAVGGNAIAANALNLSGAVGSSTLPVYFKADGTPAAISTDDEIDIIAKKANAVDKDFIYQLRGTEQWRYNGGTARTLNIVPNDMGIFDTINGSTVAGEAVFNNVVYLNDETYADSLTAENEIVTGTLRVVGDLNGSVINATTFNGNATSADKVNHWLKIQFNGTDQAQFDGSASNKTVNITPSAIGALASTTNYAGSSSVGGAATSANKLNTNAGSSTLPVYFTGGVPSAVSTTDTIDIVAKQANKTTYWLKIQADGTDQVTFDGSTSNKTLNITPELINAVRRNGDTIPGPLTLNGVFTVNNDAYIDSATIGDLLVNGGTRFVGDVNAGNITASSFSGSLTGNASTADKVNHWLKIQFNGTDKVQYDGSSENKTLNITPAAIGAVKIGGDTMTGRLTVPYITINNTGANQHLVFSRNGYNYINIPNNANACLAIGTAANGAGTWYRFIPDGFIPETTNTKSIGTADNVWANMYATTFNGNATSASKVTNKFKFQLRGTDQWEYDGSQAKTLNLSPNDMGIFDTLLGSTVSGEAVFNNVVYLNDETYADSLTAENEIVTGTLRVVGDLNGSVINATSLTGSLTGNATSADKVNHWLKIQADGTDQLTFDGSSENKTINISPELINAVRRNGDTIPGPLTLNGVMTINNDAYIDSATIGDLLVNGGTRFVGDVNAGNITASQFTGPLAGNATSANKVNKWLKIQFNGTDQAQFDGSGDNKTVNVTPAAINAVNRNGDTMAGRLTAAKGFNNLLTNVTIVPGTAGGFRSWRYNTGMTVAHGDIFTLAVPEENSSTNKILVSIDNGTNSYPIVKQDNKPYSFCNTETYIPQNAYIIIVFDSNTTYTDSSSQITYNGVWRLFTQKTWEQIYTSAYCDTASDVRNKYAICSNYPSFANLFYDGIVAQVIMTNPNTYAGSLTFGIRPKHNTSITADDVFINGHYTSATNYEYKAGSYLAVHHSGASILGGSKGYGWYFYTGNLQNKIPIYISKAHYCDYPSMPDGYNYFKFASFTIPANTTFPSSMYGKYCTFTAYYHVRGTSQGPTWTPNQMDGAFSIDFKLAIDSEGNATFVQQSGSWSILNYSFGSSNTITYSKSADNKELAYYVLSQKSNGYEYDITLDEIIYNKFSGNTTSDTKEQSSIRVHCADFTFTHFIADFLVLTNTNVSTAVLNTSYHYQLSNNTQSYYASLAYNVYENFGTDNTTSKYYLGGIGLNTSQASPTAGYYTGILGGNQHIYFLNNELYAPLHVDKFYGTSDVSYGSTLPSSPTAGQLFFHVDGGTGGGSLSVAQKSSGTMYVLGYDGSDDTKAYYNTSVYVNCSTGVLRGAAWNDYAECRKDNGQEKLQQKPGMCVKENGDGTLSITTKRLERGCEIISDTYGMLIGDKVGHNTPVAVSGRVLAYAYEDKEELKAYIGWPVCSGPNGTVSVMTEDEEEKYPSRIIGTISEIPDYDTWGQTNIKVDGRIWIRIK